MSATFQVTMLDVLREPFEKWLEIRNLVMVQPPDTEDSDEYIVIPNIEWQEGL